MIHFKNGIVINNVLIAPATITNVSSDKALLEGSDLQLFCIASGRPTPNITWVKLKSLQVVVRVMYYTGVPLGILKTSAGLMMALTAVQQEME